MFLNNYTWYTWEWFVNNKILIGPPKPFFFFHDIRGHGGCNFPNRYEFHNTYPTRAMGRVKSQGGGRSRWSYGVPLNGPNINGFAWGYFTPKSVELLYNHSIYNDRPGAHIVYLYITFGNLRIATIIMVPGVCAYFWKIWYTQFDVDFPE